MLHWHLDGQQLKLGHTHSSESSDGRLAATIVLEANFPTNSRVRNSIKPNAIEILGQNYVLSDRHGVECAGRPEWGDYSECVPGLFYVRERCTVK